MFADNISFTHGWYDTLYITACYMLNYQIHVSLYFSTIFLNYGRICCLSVHFKAKSYKQVWTGSISGHNNVICTQQLLHTVNGFLTALWVCCYYNMTLTLVIYISEVTYMCKSNSKGNLMIPANTLLVFKRKWGRNKMHNIIMVVFLIKS